MGGENVDIGSSLLTGYGQPMTRSWHVALRSRRRAVDDPSNQRAVDTKDVLRGPEIKSPTSTLAKTYPETQIYRTTYFYLHS